MAKGKSKAAKGRGKGKPPVPKSQCMTLEEDEETRCTNPPTHGSPPERCEVHQGQYVILTKEYKGAQMIVEGILGGLGLPSKAEISGYTDSRVALDKAQLIRRYVEAIRTEKTGREIHHGRFFLKMDDGHKIRLKVLAREMTSATEILDAVQARAFDIYAANHPAYEWIKEFQDSSGDTHSTSSDDSNQKSPSMQHIQNMIAAADQTKGLPTIAESQPLTDAGNQDDDLIAMKIRAQKSAVLHAFKPLLEAEEWLRFAGPAQDPSEIRLLNITRNAVLQYARRVVFHDPVLSLKAANKVSFKDLILDDEFYPEDALRYHVLWEKRMELGLLWWKDATLEALAMFPQGGATTNAANVGSPEDRFKVLGGWVFNRAHKGTMPNEAWWIFLKAANPPANIENRFVRLCNNFNDLHSFLSFGALGLVPPPSFCTDPDRRGHNSRAARNHLSLCGVVITDMISPMMPVLGPVPTATPAARRGNITWAEIQTRSYMFGAVRNEADPFTARFIEELRAQPDLFCVITRSETDPGRHVEVFGGSPNETMYQMRARNFEAPPARPYNPPTGHGDWALSRSAMDVLYGVDPIVGYLAVFDRPRSAGWFFHFKKFPVKYILILDAVYGRSVHHISRQVAWAAFRAHNLAEGDYSPQKYAAASDTLVAQHMAARLGWL